MPTPSLVLSAFIRVHLRLNCLFFLSSAAAQLIPVGTPIPKTAKPPVVFVNGYQTSCGSTQFPDTFGKFDQLLQAGGRVSLFFDNCTITGKPPIESLGNSFGSFLSALTYTDGTPVTQVDVVTHSMGGLIVRAYLAGMQTSGTFTPPPNPGIRKAVFLASPNFGTYAASIYGADAQTQELALGSTFNFTLATWNQGTDDLRGIDALAVAGNGGAMDIGSNAEGDGVVNLTSASIGFAEPNKTRIVPYCHISYSSLEALAGFLAALACPSGTAGIAQGLNSTDANVQLVTSFLNDTIMWQTIGQSPAENPIASKNSGIILRAKSAADQFVNVQDAAAGSENFSVPSGNATAYDEFLPSGSPAITVDAAGARLQQPIALNPGYTTPITVKPGPNVAAVLPAAALVFPRNIAPGTFVSIYGSALAASTAQAPGTPFPTTLSGTQVLVGGTALPLQYVSPTQINALFPTGASGLVTLTVAGQAGRSTVNVLTEPAVPAVFTSDGTSATAVNAVTGAIVAPATPLHGGDYVSLFLTGLGLTSASGGFQVAAIQPTVTVAGQPCPLQFAGLSPQFPGVDQINCLIPTALGALPSAPVIVTSNGRAANTVTLALQ